MSGSCRVRCCEDFLYVIKAARKRAARQARLGAFAASLPARPVRGPTAVQNMTMPRTPAAAGTLGFTTARRPGRI